MRRGERADMYWSIVTILASRWVPRLPPFFELFEPAALPFWGAARNEGVVEKHRVGIVWVVQRREARPRRVEVRDILGVEVG